MNTIDQRPQAGARDRVRLAVDVGIAAVPIVGGPVQLLASKVIQPHLQKRHDEWLDRLATVVAGIEQQLGELDLERIAENDLFVSAVIESTKIAYGTHLEAKLEMLQAVLLNIATTPKSDDFLALRFLGFVDELAPEHFSLLAYAVAPMAWHPDWSDSDVASGRALIDEANLDLASEVVDVVVADLAARSLIDAASLPGTTSGSDALAPFATDLGRELIEFVKVI